MTTETPVDYRSKVQELKEWYGARARVNRTGHLILQLSLILCAAALPVFAVLEWKLATIVTSCLVAAISGVSKLGRFDELWLRYRSTAEALRRECRLYDFSRLDYKTASDRDELFAERVEAAVSNELSQWAAHRTREGQQSERKDPGGGEA